MMYCKNCGNKSKDNGIFCTNCGVLLDVKDTNDMVSDHKNNVALINEMEKLSKISFIIFVVIMIANIVVYPLSLTDDETSGAYWFFLVLLPSIPLFFGSLILSIVSIKNFFSRKTQYMQVTKSRKVFAYLNVMQFILMMIIMILIYLQLTWPY